MVQQRLHFGAAQQFGCMRRDQMVQVGGHHSARIDHGVAHVLRFILQTRIDPHGRQAEGGIGGDQARQGAARHARIDRQVLAAERFAGAHFHALEGDPVGRRLELEVVADVHRRRQKTDFLRELLADALDALEQLAALRLVDQGNEAVAHFQPQRIDRHDVLPARFFALRRGRRRWRGFLNRLGRLALLADQVAGANERTCQQDEDKIRHARDQAHAANDGAGDVQHVRLGEQLAHQLGADVLVGGHARDYDTGGGGNDQRRNLRHQAVADGQQRIGFQRLAKRQVVLQHAHQQAADDVNHGDHDAGHGVAAHILGGAVHGAVEFRFLAHFQAPPARFVFGDQAGVQVGVDRHLLAGHGVERETGAHFGDPAGALGDDGKVNDGQDDEDDDTHRVIAADQEVAERFDHLARRRAAGVAFGQHDTGRGHIERQAQHGRDQQNGGKGHEVERLDRIQAGQQDDHCQRDVKAEEHVEHERRQRQDHHRQQQDDDDRRGQGVAAALHSGHPSWHLHGAAPLFVSGGFFCAAGFSGSSSSGTARRVGRSGWAAPPCL